MQEKPFFKSLWYALKTWKKSYWFVVLFDVIIVIVAFILFNALAYSFQGIYFSITDDVTVLNPIYESLTSVIIIIMLACILTFNKLVVFGVKKV
jgi:hypothetical protein